VFRHSFATLLKGNGEDGAGVSEARGQQNHAGHVRAGANANKKAAQRKVFEAVVPKCSLAIVSRPQVLDCNGEGA